MPLADEGPELPASRHNKRDGTPPPKPYGFVMSHQQENRCILPSPILFLENSVTRQKEKGKEKPGSARLPGHAFVLTQGNLVKSMSSATVCRV